MALWVTVAAEVAVIPWDVQRGETDVSSGVYVCKCWVLHYVESAACMR